jgi:hypothetical protein
VLAIKPGASFTELDSIFALGDVPATGQIQTNLNAVRMKASPPIHGLVGHEIVPFEAEAQLPVITVQLPPALADAVPCGRFAETGLACATVFFSAKSVILFARRQYSELRRAEQG